MNLSNFYTHPRDYLLLELEKRQRRNSSYSLRALARDLQVAPSTLSEVIKGHYGLSENKAKTVAKALELNEEHSIHFVELFQRRFSKKKDVRRKASRASHARRAQAYQSLPLDEFKSIADWSHTALLEWMSIHGGKLANEPKVIRRAAKSLRIEASDVVENLKRLERIGQVEVREGFWHLQSEYSATGGDIPDEAIRQFHAQILSKAAASLDGQEVGSREISSTIFSFSSQQMVEAKQMLRDFRREFGERFGGAPGPDAVYCLGLQFFALSELEGNDEK